MKIDKKIKTKNNKMNKVNLFTKRFNSYKIYQSLKLEAYFGPYDTASNIYDKDLLQNGYFSEAATGGAL